MRQRELLTVLAMGLSASVALSQSGHARKAAVGDADAGAGLFKHHCIMCHTIQPGLKIVGPSLNSVMRGPHALTATQVRAVTQNGKGVMPAFRLKLTDKELADLLAYLRQL